MKQVEEPVVGAMADHISRALDPRMVTKVSEDKTEVWLRLLSGDHGPFPAENYTYSIFARVEP